MANHDKLEKTSLRRSSEIDEIIGSPPSWLVQWGISVFFIILLLIFGVSYYIKYPETIKFPFQLISNNPAVPISVNENGTLIKLLIKEHSEVNKSDILFYWQEDNGTKQHALISPLDGRINYISPLFDGRKIERGQFLFYITSNDSIFYAIIYINLSGIHRIKLGQVVKLELREYSGSEYGCLNGVIDYVGTIRTSKGYYVRAILPKGLKSDKNIQIAVEGNEEGDAEIVINRRRLIDKIFNKK